MHTETLIENVATPSESRDEVDVSAQPDAALNEMDALVQNNRHTIDDPSRQALTMDEIEELKKSASGSGKDIVAKILESHSAIGEKTAFSLAKYTLRKSKKYMRRFTVLPLDVSLLVYWILHEKEPVRIMELREETLGLIASLSNVHNGLPPPCEPASQIPSGRWLVVDDTAGLLVAIMAERMGILYPESPHEVTKETRPLKNGTVHPPQATDNISKDARDQKEVTPAVNPSTSPTSPGKRKLRPPTAATFPIHNTLTLVHPASQPNVSLLSYFGYDPNSSTYDPTTCTHPLSTHLKPLSFLQLLQPHQSPLYHEPPLLSPETLASMKTRQRGTYYRKRRRWESVKSTINEARAGGFDGLVVASVMEPFGLLRTLVPLLRGGAPVVLYCPDVERLSEVCDAYSSGRKSAFLKAREELSIGQDCAQDHVRNGDKDVDMEDESDEVLYNDQDVGERSGAKIPLEDFPVDPRLLLAPTVQTTRARDWQVLPGRTHPAMMARGGAEGYVFNATRVLPVEGKPAARGTFGKKRKGSSQAVPSAGD